MGSISLPHRHWLLRQSYPILMAFVTAWLLAVNTLVIQMPLPLTKLTLLSAKFACWTYLCVCISMIIQGRKIAEKKVKANKNSSAADDQQLAADKTWPISIVFDNVCKCIMGKRMDFPDLKSNTSHQLFRSNLMSRACEVRAGLIHRLANDY